MKKTLIVLALLVAACGSRPPAAPPADTPRLAVEIRYVGVPSMQVYARPNETAPVVTHYAYTETVSVLARSGDWVEIRTVDGSAWARAADLISAAEVEPILTNTTPRFLTAPVTIPNPRARGEITIQANVNTDGEVVAAWPVKNTTGLKQLADANVAALRQARFYPIVQKGQRLTFSYLYDVVY